MKTYILIIFSGFTMGIVYSQVGIGTINPTNSSMLEISSTSDGGLTYKGFMPPRVSNTAERDLINPTAIDVGLLIFVKNIGCIQIWNGSSWENSYCLDTIPIEPWINEFHYDNIGGDIGEFIEIAGPSGLDLSNYRILLYNGATGASYYGITLSGILPNESNNYGALSFSPPSIQNEMEGIALIKISNNKVLQFISYEGSFMATNNTANGIMSIDIGFYESENTTPIGFSLQLTGSGNTYSNFIWNPPASESPGFLNTGQQIN